MKIVQESAIGVQHRWLESREKRHNDRKNPKRGEQDEVWGEISDPAMTPIRLTRERAITRPILALDP